ncbi:MAG: TIGR02265 family protein [Thermoplasmatota archaeon]
MEHPAAGVSTGPRLNHVHATVRQFGGTLPPVAIQTLIAFLRENGWHSRVRVNLEQAHGLDLDALAQRAAVPFDAYAAALDALAEIDPRAPRNFGRFSAARIEKAVPGAALLLRFASPKRLVSSAPMLWSRYANFGHAKIVHASSNDATLAIHGSPGHAPFCASLAGFFAGILARGGARVASVDESSCHAHGSEACTFHATWS